MDSEEGKGSEQDLQDDYEATVLSFLDQEIAAAKSEQNLKGRDQPDELDALVSELLKQIIAESDQLRENPTVKPADADEFLPGSLSGHESNLHVSGPPVSYPETLIGENENSGSFSDPGKSLDNQRPTSPLASLVAQRMAPNRRIPASALIFLCLLVAGAGVYYFAGSPVGATSKGEDSLAAGTATAISGGKDTMPFFPQSEEENGTQKQTTPILDPEPSKTKLADSNPGTSLKRPRAAEKETEASVEQSILNTTDSRRNSAKQQIADATSNPMQAEKFVPGPLAELSNMQTDFPSSQGKDIEAPARSAEAPPLVVSNVTPPSKTATKEFYLPMPERTTSLISADENNAMRLAADASTNPEISLPDSSTLASIPMLPTKVTSAVLINQVDPVYPDFAKRTRASASIVLDLQIDEEGNVTQAVPVNGPAIFHDAAVTAVKKWRYKPASVGGTNVPSQSRVTIVFNLK